MQSTDHDDSQQAPDILKHHVRLRCLLALQPHDRAVILPAQARLEARRRELAAATGATR